MRAQNSILGREIFALKEQSLVDQTGYVRQQPRPFVVLQVNVHHTGSDAESSTSIILTTRRHREKGEGDRYARGTRWLGRNRHQERRGCEIAVDSRVTIGS